ncbi:MAG: lysophospholipid acyltransferase family protein [bacterium]|nr:lysophospholipid acyltransferase family protein [bacterium]
MSKQLTRWLKFELLPRIATLLLKAFAWSWRVEQLGYPNLSSIDSTLYERKIVAVWHGRLLLTACILRDCDIHVIVSDHDDGELVTRVVERLGFHAVRGSSTRGGVKAALGAVDAITAGKTGGMLPDGPRGPRHKAKLGTVWLSREADAWIVPVSGSASSAWQFDKSWDKMLLPKPFAKVKFLIGEPLPPPLNTTTDAMKSANRKLEEVLTNVEHRTDREAGRASIA